MERPGPGGEIPEGWQPNRWAAWLALQDGATYTGAAEAAGVKRGTISRWVQDWRARWGDDIYQSPRAGTGPSPEAAAMGGTNAGLVSQARSADLRAVTAKQCGQAAAKAAEATEAALDALLADPVRLSRLEPKEILELARIAEVLNRAAHLAAAEVGPQNEEGTRRVDLTRLEQSDQHNTMRATALTLIERFKSEAIEVTEVA